MGHWCNWRLQERKNLQSLRLRAQGIEPSIPALPLDPWQSWQCYSISMCKSLCGNGYCLRVTLPRQVRHLAMLLSASLPGTNSIGTGGLKLNDVKRHRNCYLKAGLFEPCLRVVTSVTGTPRPMADLAWLLNRHVQVIITQWL